MDYGDYWIKEASFNELRHLNPIDASYLPCLINDDTHLLRVKPDIRNGVQILWI